MFGILLGVVQFSVCIKGQPALQAFKYVIFVALTILIKAPCVFLFSNLQHMPVRCMPVESICPVKLSTKTKTVNHSNQKVQKLKGQQKQKLI